MMTTHARKQNPGERREYHEWLALCDSIKASTPLPTGETETQKRKRVETLKQDFTAFCKYYFAHYMDAPFAWFHLKAAADITADKNCRIVLEWPREHAKSVFSDVFIPLFLYARGELTGLVLASANEDKASGLLGDLQAQFTSNERFIHDYGSRAAFGDWRDSHFATTDGCGFWAFGRGQSPRGVRKAAKRPNIALVDDIDDKVIVRNIGRVRDAVDWVLEDLYGACAIQAARLIISGNRIHQAGILAHLVGDVKPTDPKREGFRHIKVFALENKKHQKDLNGQPAWKERYTREHITGRISAIGTRSALREYFHEHIEEGEMFKHDWIHWAKSPHPGDISDIEVYCDPSFKDGKSNDFKAIIVVAKKKGSAPGAYTYYILDAWIRQASVNAMVKAFYDFYDRYGERARYRMEANFVQDLLLRDFDAEAIATGRHLPIRADKRAKPDKTMRVENLSPLFERGIIAFDQAQADSHDMQTLVNQFLAFPNGGHDDGPDACEGALHYLNRTEARDGGMKPRLGKFCRARSRRT